MYIIHCNYIIGIMLLLNGGIINRQLGSSFLNNIPSISNYEVSMCIDMQLCQYEQLYFAHFLVFQDSLVGSYMCKTKLSYSSYDANNTLGELKPVSADPVDIVWQCRYNTNYIRGAVLGTTCTADPVDIVWYCRYNTNYIRGAVLATTCIS